MDPKALSENRDKLRASDASQLEAVIQEGRQAVEQQDSALMADVLARLELEANRVASVISQGAGAEQDGSASKSGEAGARPGKDVVDAEFEETP